MKTCTKCGECKPLDHFHCAPKYRLGVASQCKKCKHEANKAWRAANPDRVRKLQDKHLAKRKIEIAKSPELQKKRREAAAKFAATEKGRDYRARLAKKHRDELTDAYVKTTFFNGQPHKGVAIPKELISLKREQLSLQRLAKSLQQAAKKDPNESID